MSAIRSPGEESRRQHRRGDPPVSSMVGLRELSKSSTPAPRMRSNWLAGRGGGRAVAGGGPSCFVGGRAEGIVEVVHPGAANAVQLAGWKGDDNEWSGCRRHVLTMRESWRNVWPNSDVALGRTYSVRMRSGRGTRSPRP